MYVGRRERESKRILDVGKHFLLLFLLAAAAAVSAAAAAAGMRHADTQFFAYSERNIYLEVTTRRMIMHVLGQCR